MMHKVQALLILALIVSVLVGVLIKEGIEYHGKISTVEEAVLEFCTAYPEAEPEEVCRHMAFHMEEDPIVCDSIPEEIRVALKRECRQSWYLE